jgi:hypothetical protein
MLNIGILIYTIIFTLFNYNITINKESVHANTFIQIIAIQWISFQHVFKSFFG